MIDRPTTPAGRTTDDPTSAATIARIGRGHPAVAPGSSTVRSAARRRTATGRPTPRPARASSRARSRPPTRPPTGRPAGWLAALPGSLGRVRLGPPGPATARGARRGRRARRRTSPGRGGIRRPSTGASAAGGAPTPGGPREDRPARHEPAHPDRRGRGWLADVAGRVRRTPGRGPRRRAPSLCGTGRHPGPGGGARGAAVHPRPRLAPGPAQRRVAPAQRRGGRRPRRDLPEHLAKRPSARRPSRHRRAPSSISCSPRWTICPARSATCTVAGCASRGPTGPRR